MDVQPVRGSKADKRRPAVIVSNDGANAAAARSDRGVVTVVPITTNPAAVYAFQVLLPAGTAGLARDSKAQAEQVRSVSVSRVTSALGTLPAALVDEIDEALRLHLSL